MNLFKKSSEEKFEDEKRKRQGAMLIKMYRDEKLNIPHTKFSKIIIDECNKIDPEGKLSERELIERLFESGDAKKALIKASNEDSLITDDMVREYIDRYYALLRDVLTSPDPKVWDAYEYQSQQLISVCSLEKIELFRTYLASKMDSDATCPYYVKKTFLGFLNVKDVPTVNDEETAEDIMDLVCPDLKKHNEEVWRALVDSLKWRGSDTLKKTMEQVKKTPKEKRHLRGRESCLFIETEEGVHYVG